MSLLDSASLVVTPNGYKASKLYSIVPSDGTGDMTFARTGDTATRVNSSGYIESVLANKPRLDYLGGGCPKLLLEPQRTNYYQYSNDFSNAYWSKYNVTISTNTDISPDGTQNADRIISSNATNGQSIEGGSNSYTSGSINTIGAFFKYNNHKYIQLLFPSFVSTNYANFDIELGTIVGGTYPSGASIVSYGNGWYRCTLSAVSAYSGGSASTPCQLISSASSSRGENFVGDGIKSVIIWGAQAETGSYATSYIPTTSASVTRNADSCSKTGISSLIGQTEGTLFGDFYLESAAEENWILSVQASTSTFIAIFTLSDRRPYFYVLNGGVSQLSYIGTALSVGRHKMSIAYKANDFACYIDGNLVYSKTSGTVPTCPDYNIGNFIDGGVRKAIINSVALWKTRLQNADLAALTTI